MFLSRNYDGIFYGWWIVSGSFVTAIYTGGAIFYGFTSFFEPIIEEMGWSYTQVSLAASLRGMEMGIFAPFIGMLVDRLGPRRLIFAGGSILAMGLVLLSTTNCLATFYAAFTLLAIGMSACTGTVIMTAIANWFDRRIGLATGIAISGYGFSGLLVPVITRLIAMYQWRIAAVVLAIGMLVIVLPLSALFRHKPEQYGYLPDGFSPTDARAKSETASQTTRVEVRAKDAIKGVTFWRLGLAYLYQVMVVSATVTHVMPYLGSVGVSRSISSLVAMGIPLASVIGRLGLGWLADRYDRRVVAAVAFGLIGLGVLLFAQASAKQLWIVVPFLFLVGIGYGGGNALRPTLVRQFFGRANFGTVFGLMMGIGAIGSIIGSTLPGWVYDHWGRYQGIWYLLASLAIVSVVMVLSVPLKTVTINKAKKTWPQPPG
jgi:MFS transporter, OFA family, oxalate/formate antiporter